MRIKDMLDRWDTYRIFKGCDLDEDKPIPDSNHGCSFIGDAIRVSLEQLIANKEKLFMDLVREVIHIEDRETFNLLVANGFCVVYDVHVIPKVGDRSLIDLTILSDEHGFYLGSIITDTRYVESTGCSLKHDQEAWKHIPTLKNKPVKDIIEDPSIVTSLIDFNHD